MEKTIIAAVILANAIESAGTSAGREDIKFAVIRDAVHLLEGFHIRFGDHKIESGIAGHVGQDWRF